ncbi:MAG: hypothetical protein HRU09_11735 [Oligoflexales bacterium]|nr:hypothetical protein [Oligoflexales bacterium]
MIKFLYPTIMLILFINQSKITFAAAECSGNASVINEHLYFQNPSSQGPLGICYAHSVANIYGSLYQQTHGEFVFPSPIMLSMFSGMHGYKAAPFKTASWRKKLLYLTPIFGWEAYLLDKYYGKENKLIDRITGGQFAEAFADAISTQPCSIESIEWFLDVQSSDLDIKDSLSLYYEFIKFLKEMRPQSLHKGTLSAQALVSYMKEKGYEINREILQKFMAIDHYIKNHGFAKNQLIGKAFVKRTLANFLMHRCKEFNAGREFGELKYKIKNYYAVVYGRERLIRMLDQHFTDSQSLPVELGYCYGHLKDKEECEYHSSVIYGKTCHQDKLYFLVRNSWGGKSLRKRYVTPGTSHSRHGDYWMSTDDLKKSWKNGKGDLNFIENLAI